MSYQNVVQVIRYDIETWRMTGPSLTSMKDLKHEQMYMYQMRVRVSVLKDIRDQMVMTWHLIHNKMFFIFIKTEGRKCDALQPDTLENK